VSICITFSIRDIYCVLTYIRSMNGIMGIANAQRTLTYLRIITEFVTQDQYLDVVGV